MKQSLASGDHRKQFFLWTGLFAAVLVGTALIPGGPVQAADPDELLRQLNDYPHAGKIAASEEAVVDHEIGLGAIQKVRGVWRLKNSERLSGQLSRYTWQILDGFSSREVMEELEQAVVEQEGSELLFSCDGRACGQGVQWANRVFHQRVLYGREDLQRYRVYTLRSGEEYRLVIYSSARTADRQYLHVDLLKIAEED